MRGFSATSRRKVALWITWPSVCSSTTVVRGAGSCVASTIDRSCQVGRWAEVRSSNSCICGTPQWSTVCDRQAAAGSIRLPSRNPVVSGSSDTVPGASRAADRKCGRTITTLDAWRSRNANPGLRRCWTRRSAGGKRVENGREGTSTDACFDVAIALVAPSCDEGRQAPAQALHPRSRSSSTCSVGR